MAHMCRTNGELGGAWRLCNELVVTLLLINLVSAVLLLDMAGCILSSFFFLQLQLYIETPHALSLPHTRLNEHLDSGSSYYGLVTTEEVLAGRSAVISFIRT
jgi:hypothetical protein